MKSDLFVENYSDAACSAFVPYFLSLRNQSGRTDSCARPHPVNVFDANMDCNAREKVLNVVCNCIL